MKHLYRIGLLMVLALLAGCAVASREEMPSYVRKGNTQIKDGIVLVQFSLYMEPGVCWNLVARGNGGREVLRTQETTLTGPVNLKLEIGGEPQKEGPAVFLNQSGEGYIKVAMATVGSRIKSVTTDQGQPLRIGEENRLLELDFTTEDEVKKTDGVLANAKTTEKVRYFLEFRQQEKTQDKEE